MCKFCGSPCERRFCNASCAGKYGRSVQLGSVEAKSINHCQTCQAETTNPKFCSRSCAAKTTNSNSPKRGDGTATSKKLCPGGCETLIGFRSGMCWPCRSAQKRSVYIKDWLNGSERGGSDYNLSRIIRAFLLEQAGHACSKCGWSISHPDTGEVPLEVNHIDGDGTNHSPANLEVLCANCHSLTSSYRGRNAGKGRPYSYHRVRK